jgi:hypothetical protein
MTELEIRVERLEHEVEVLKTRSGGNGWWKKIAGSFANDEGHDEAMKLGREYRSSQNADLNKNGDDNS